MIEAHGLVKRYGSTVAVNDLSFSVRPGMVTGFLGPNGAGKPDTGLRRSLLPGARNMRLWHVKTRRPSYEARRTGYCLARPELAIYGIYGELLTW